ncbi:MAG TPA: hypothetical protein VJ276_00925 [Thermoanaerobaculia bacterium]|nr:hypothetical protein [Thermoanaerobaculia bacterium]
MWSDFWASFFGALGGIGALVAGLYLFGGKLLDHRLEKSLDDYRSKLATDLAVLENGMQRLGDVLSRRNEREFAVTEKAWELMISAFGTAQVRFGNGRQVPVFMMMPEREAMKIIASLPFPEEDKQVLRDLTPAKRDELYELFDLRESYGVGHKLWAEFKNYVSSHEIFFDEEICQAFVEIRDELYGVLCHVEMFTDPDSEAYDRRTADRMLRDIHRKVSGLATAIRARFGFNEK